MACLLPIGKMFCSPEQFLLLSRFLVVLLLLAKGLGEGGSSREYGEPNLIVLLLLAGSDCVRAGQASNCGGCSYVSLLDGTSSSPLAAAAALASSALSGSSPSPLASAASAAARSAPICLA